MRTLHDEEIKPGLCTYCGRPTRDNPEFLLGEWSHAHSDCEKISALAMEDSANKKLRDNPDDPVLRVIAGLCEEMADQACAGK